MRARVCMRACVVCVRLRASMCMCMYDGHILVQGAPMGPRREKWEIKGRELGRVNFNHTHLQWGCDKQPCKYTCGHSQNPFSTEWVGAVTCLPLTSRLVTAVQCTRAADNRNSWFDCFKSNFLFSAHRKELGGVWVGVPKFVREEEVGREGEGKARTFGCLTIA